MQSSFECSAYEDRLNVLKEPCSSVIVPCKLREQEKKKTRSNVVILFSPLKFPREFFSVTLRKKVKLSLKKLKKEQWLHKVSSLQARSWTIFQHSWIQTISKDEQEKEEFNFLVKYDNKLLWDVFMSKPLWHDARSNFSLLCGNRSSLYATV